MSDATHAPSDPWQMSSREGAAASAQTWPHADASSVWAAPGAAPGAHPSTWSNGFPVRPSPSFARQNQGTLTVLVVVAVYIVIASFTGIVLLGIAPALMAVNVMKRREPLRFVAVAAAGAAVFMALSGLHR